uniref:Nucleoporin p58/p45 n=1 Tax=Meloidogyne incognita TaxID=6306 RepID=A0A914LPX2_MELIC
MQLSTPSNLQPLEAPVPPELLAQLEILEKTLKENKQIYSELKNESPSNEMTSLESKVTGLGRLISQYKGFLKGERLKNSVLSEKINLDQKISQNIQKSRDQQTKRGHSIDYLHEVASLNERQLEDLWGSVQKLSKTLERLKSDDSDSTSISRSELAAHIQRFDQIFEAVAGQVYLVNEATEKLRDCFIERRKKIYGQFDADPFEKAKERQNIINSYSTLKGVDAFPSSNAILSLSEYLPRQPSQSAQPQFGITPFGPPLQQQQPGTSLFGVNVSKPPTSFSFNNPSVTSSLLFGTANKPATNTSLFGTASATTTTTSLFGQPTTATTSLASIPLFGSTTTQQSTAGQQPAGTALFSNTLNSASSGTLFKGSAVATPNRPTLFGGLQK